MPIVTRAVITGRRIKISERFIIMKEEGRRKKEEGRRKREEVVGCVALQNT
ncbi:hypothetical protein QUB56_08815 [Microcoleus sp. AR_TQ3_B6]|uniref:hypothetical protein n=1 Tax=Microcoleus sp. AR_TQ3_B6 TaxID=3055284 RepID=UPI002FD6F71B